jgi:hypothetical protein
LRVGLVAGAFIQPVNLAVVLVAGCLFNYSTNQLFNYSTNHPINLAATWVTIFLASPHDCLGILPRKFYQGKMAENYCFICQYVRNKGYGV